MGDSSSRCAAMAVIRGTKNSLPSPLAVAPRLGLTGKALDRIMGQVFRVVHRGKTLDAELVSTRFE